MTTAERMQAIRERLTQAFAPTELAVIDDGHLHVGHAGAKGGGHFSVKISAPTLSALPRVKAHQLIYGELADLIPTEVHALSIQIVANTSPSAVAPNN